MDDLHIELYRPELAEDALAIRNAIFPPIGLEEWLKTTTMSGVVAYLGDEVVGCIPMDRRAFLLAPGVSVPVVFENAVGTREDLRSQGIGTAMIRAAREYLSDEVDALMVYRGAERSPGYRFYARTGHQDMLYLRPAHWAQPCGSSGHVGVGGPEEIDAEAEAIHRVFGATYHAHGGFPPRSVGYQGRQLRHQIYAVLPQETLYFRYPKSGELQAYCIAGIRTGARAEAVVMLQELAAASAEAARMLLDGIGAYASGRGCAVSCQTGHDDPFHHLLLSMGFDEGPRSLMLLAQPLDLQRLFLRTCEHPELLEDLRISVWTPALDAVLYEGPCAKVDVCIEAKSGQLARMLCRRLDVHWATEQGIISIRNATGDIVHRLSAARPLSHWTYHALDYI